MHIGEVYVHGHEKETAQALLAACNLVGVDEHTIRATDEGFIVSSEVWDAAERILSPELSEAAI